MKWYNPQWLTQAIIFIQLHGVLSFIIAMILIMKEYSRLQCTFSILVFVHLA